ncbi:uncharacterized protein LY89DRAFT_731168 [Mollisia scopiformis]|uniref:Uncharacterized protein n=1 Tax=Mollisia scopiformis TaxID=149040 RepID=A0A194XJI7_MOLSC|nr:uncharacterized protein LY89DRAFT_731168 [Mollisia scopiformis]KUJ19922.1 hypothetical protein LY89DRAFT_731168 [Mollisia scopiformis]
MENPNLDPRFFEESRQSIAFGPAAVADRSEPDHVAAPHQYINLNGQIYKLDPTLSAADFPNATPVEIKHTHAKVVRRWSLKEYNFIFNLVRAKINEVKRKLKEADFKDITNALNAQFSGQFVIEAGELLAPVFRKNASKDAKTEKLSPRAGERFTIANRVVATVHDYITHTRQSEYQALCEELLGPA